jgi:hypothetical protein
MVAVTATAARWPVDQGHPSFMIVATLPSPQQTQSYCFWPGHHFGADAPDVLVVPTGSAAVTLFGTQGA